MNIIFFKLLLLVPFLAGKPDFSLKLAYYTKPLIHKQWEIHIYRQNRSITINNTNYLHTSYSRSFPQEDYTTLLIRLNRLGVWTAKDDYYKMSGNEYYLLTITSKDRNNSFKIEAHHPSGGKYAQYRAIVRLIENYARQMVPEK